MQVLSLGGCLLFSQALPADASFSADIVPLFKARCVACHLTGEEPGGLALHPGSLHRSLVGVRALGAAMPRVSAGDPQRSYLLHKLEGSHLAVGGQGERMPLAETPLSAADIERVRAWIAAGAKDR